MRNTILCLFFLIVGIAQADGFNYGNYGQMNGGNSIGEYRGGHYRGDRRSDREERSTSSQNYQQNSVVSYQQYEQSRNAGVYRSNEQSPSVMSDGGLRRTAGKVQEGYSLGTTSDGCRLSAVRTTPDTPVGHKVIYNDGGYSKTMNYKECQDGSVREIGESMETHAPQSIHPEMDRVLGMCKLRGASSSSYLGYDIACERLGDNGNPTYQTTVVKKDTLVERTYSK